MAEDLDAFLTSLESKLRGPYSSLELSRIISTQSLRGGLTAKQYLESISQVLSRTDKNTYLRTIVGLLGLEPDKETDEDIYKILTSAMEPEREEWVRVVAGLARGILFVDNANDDDYEEGEEDVPRASCRGEEASDMLKKTCQEILDQTRQLERDTEEKDSKNNSLQTTDTYPLYVSYRYSLLDPQLLDRVIPEHKDNPYFQCDDTAEILTVDDKLETAKAEESQDHNLLTTTKQVKEKEEKKKAVQAIMPGMKKTTAPTTTSTAKKAVTNRPKSSMFMPSRKPMAAGRGIGRQVPTKGTLHTRRAGAAQSLLEKNRRVAGLAAPGAARAAQMGRTQKLTNNKSKMKMIDVTEVRGLNNAHQKRDDKLARKENAQRKLLERKRKIMEAAAEKGLVAAPKLQKLEDEAKDDQLSDEDEGADPMEMVNSNTGNGFMAFGNDDEDDEDEEDNNDNNNNGGSNEEWQTILAERSNKLTEEDRLRVQQFYTNQYNPTPDQNVYKMKLHEERTTDPATGQALKETYYLELDYTNFTSKQSKKVKRY